MKKKTGKFVSLSTSIVFFFTIYRTRFNKKKKHLQLIHFSESVVCFSSFHSIHRPIPHRLLLLFFELWFDWQAMNVVDMDTFIYHSHQYTALRCLSVTSKPSNLENILKINFWRKSFSFSYFFFSLHTLWHCTPHTYEWTMNDKFNCRVLFWEWMGEVFCMFFKWIFKCNFENYS